MCMCVFFGFNLVEVDFVARERMKFCCKKENVGREKPCCPPQFSWFQLIQVYLKMGGENLLEEKGQNFVVILKSIMSFEPLGSHRSLMIKGTCLYTQQTLNFTMVLV